MLRRLLRIFPIYYLLLIVLAMVRPKTELAWSALYLGNFADVFFPTHGLNPLQHTWSLCVEETYNCCGRWSSPASRPRLDHASSSAWCLAPPGPMTFCNRMLALAPLRAIGRISYGFYLYHLPIFHNVMYSKTVHEDDAGTNVLLAVILTFLVATASYWLVERPILQYAGRFRQRQSLPESANA